MEKEISELKESNKGFQQLLFANQKVFIELQEQIYLLNSENAELKAFEKSVGVYFSGQRGGGGKTRASTPNEMFEMRSVNSQTFAEPVPSFLKASMLETDYIKESPEAIEEFVIHSKLADITKAKEATKHKLSRPPE